MTPEVTIYRTRRYLVRKINTQGRAVLTVLLKPFVNSGAAETYRRENRLGSTWLVYKGQEVLARQTDERLGLAKINYQSGQSLLELVVILPVLAALFYGLAWLGIQLMRWLGWV
jgi:hypothetical protein